MKRKTDLESFGIAMSMWYRFNEAYKTRPIRYQKLLEQKIALKISPLRKIKDTDLRAYPDIPFLKTTTEDEAENFLLECTSSQLSVIIHSIEMLSINYTFNTMGTFIKDAEYLILSHGKRKSLLGFDPEYSTIGATRHHRGSHRGQDSDEDR